MAVAAKSSYEPITRNFKLIAHHELNGFGGMGEGMSIQIAKDGRRILWLAHESAPKNFTAVDVSDPRAPKIVVQTDLPASPHALQLAGDGRRHHGGRLPGAEARTEAGGLRAVRHLRARDAQVDRLRRRLRARLARRAPAVVLRRRDRAHGRRRARLQADQPARRPVLPRLRRAQSVEARGGQPLVDAGHPRGRHGRAARPPQAAALRHGLSRPQHQRLSAAPRPLLPRLHRRRHVHPRHLRQGEPEAALPLGQLPAVLRLHPHRAAAVRARAADRHRRVGRWTTPRTGRS